MQCNFIKCIENIRIFVNYSIVFRDIFASLYTDIQTCTKYQK